MKYIAYDLKDQKHKLLPSVRQWEQNTDYKAQEDLVVYNNSQYYCAVDHNSLNLFDSSKWIAFNSLSPATPMEFHKESLPNERTEIIRDWQ